MRKTILWRAALFAGALFVVGVPLLEMQSPVSARAPDLDARAPDAPFARGRTATLLVDSTRAEQCGLRTSPPHGRRGRLHPIRLEAGATEVSWQIPRMATSGRWRVGLRCGHRVAGLGVRVRGRSRGGSQLIAEGSLQAHPLHPSLQVDSVHQHGDLPAAPPGPDPASWSNDPPPDDSGAAVPAFAIPFRCGETWAGATYPGHAGDSEYPVDFNHDDPAFEATAPAVASADGVVSVSRTGSNEGYGNYVVVDHGGGWTTLYSHLADVPQRGEGEAVARGDSLGIVGTTGNSSGVHLHYEQRFAGELQPVRFADGPFPYSYTYPGPAITSDNCGPDGSAGADSAADPHGRQAMKRFSVFALAPFASAT